MPNPIEVRGLSVASTCEFVHTRFDERYAEWFESLPPATRAIIAEIHDNQWYPLEDGITIPTGRICELFYDGSPDGAREVGRFSAEYVFKGMYKVFIKMGTPLFTLSRACKIFESYLRPLEVRVTSLNATDALIRLEGLEQPDQLIELRIVGWIERALELHGCRASRVSMRCDITEPEHFSEIAVSWSIDPAS